MNGSCIVYICRRHDDVLSIRFIFFLGHSFCYLFLSRASLEVRPNPRNHLQAALQASSFCSAVKMLACDIFADGLAISEVIERWYSDSLDSGGFFGLFAWARCACLRGDLEVSWEGACGVLEVLLRYCGAGVVYNDADGSRVRVSWGLTVLVILSTHALSRSDHTMKLTSQIGLVVALAMAVSAAPAWPDYPIPYPCPPIACPPDGPPTILPRDPYCPCVGGGTSTPRPPPTTSTPLPAPTPPPNPCDG